MLWIKPIKSIYSLVLALSACNKSLDAMLVPALLGKMSSEDSRDKHHVGLQLTSSWLCILVSNWYYPSIVSRRWDRKILRYSRRDKLPDQASALTIVYRTSPSIRTANEPIGSYLSALGSESLHCRFRRHLNALPNSPFVLQLSSLEHIVFLIPIYGICLSRNIMHIIPLNLVSPIP